MLVQMAARGIRGVGIKHLRSLRFINCPYMGMLEVASTRNLGCVTSA